MTIRVTSLYTLAVEDIIPLTCDGWSKLLWSNQIKAVRSGSQLVDLIVNNK